MKTFYLNKHNGQITNKSMLAKNLADLKDGRYEIRIENIRKRSTPLNKYYWGCVIEYQREGFKGIGHDLSKEEIHEFNKSEFDYKEILVNERTHQILKIPGSTKQMTNTKMLDFIEKIKQFSAEWLNTYIPDPNEQSKIWDTIVAERDNELNTTIVKK